MAIVLPLHMAGRGERVDGEDGVGVGGVEEAAGVAVGVIEVFLR